ncbi:S-adenosyl-L-methionine-dependent methyltransferase, partial [Coniophora puteana RWD-64-598 SS2]
MLSRALSRVFVLPCRRSVLTATLSSTASAFTDAATPKRRGRPPRTDTTNPKPSTEESASPPKKRGRRPKEPQTVNELTTKSGAGKVIHSPAPPRPVASKPAVIIPADKWELPPLETWSDVFPTSGQASTKPPMMFADRVTLRDPDTAWGLANAFIPEIARDKVIIEAFPGPGVLTRALLDLPRERVQKIILLEDVKVFREYLEPLAKADPRIEIIPLNAVNWDTYEQIDLNKLGVQSLPWDEPHPNLHWIAQLPVSSMGEQLMSQLMRCIPDKSWLFNYGRIPMSVLMYDWVWERMSANMSNRARCKLTMMTKAAAEADLAVDPDLLTPPGDKFYPGSVLHRSGKTRPVVPMAAVNFLPHLKPSIKPGMVDKWDYCLRRLYVQKSTPLEKAVGNLAPGAQTLLRYLTDPSAHPSERLDVKKAIRTMDPRDWAAFISAFDRWPFAPEDLSISNSFTHQERDS